MLLQEEQVCTVITKAIQRRGGGRMQENLREKKVEEENAPVTLPSSMVPQGKSATKPR